jgi:hypothetical protein
MIQKVQRLAIEYYCCSISHFPYPELKEVILLLERTGFTHECTSHGRLCLVDLDTIAETSQSLFGDRREIQYREESWKRRWEMGSLRGDRGSKCPKVKSVAVCYKGLESFWVAQEEVDQFLLSRTA